MYARKDEGLWHTINPDNGLPFCAEQFQTSMIYAGAANVTTRLTAPEESELCLNCVDAIVVQCEANSRTVRAQQNALDKLAARLRNRKSKAQEG